MNCTVIKRRLLSAEQPDEPADDVKSHLAQCPACCAWHSRLVQIERTIPLLPLPPSTAKAHFLHRLGGTRTTDSVQSSLGDPRNHWRSASMPGLKERGMRKVSVAFALAASLLLFALVWWSWPHQNGPAPDHGKQEQAQLDRRLAIVLHNQTPKERLLSLADLAEQIHGEAQQMADHREKLDRWARFYSLVVGRHLMEEARRLPAEERAEVLKDIVSRLARTESRATRFAAQLEPDAPQSASSFYRIASAARSGERDLRALMKS